MACVCFLGLGAMGLPMARRLLAAGDTVRTAVHRNPAPARELEALGASVHSSPAEAAAGAEFVISILPEDRQLREVLLDDAMTAAVPPGAMLIEMSSASSAAVRDVADKYAARGIDVLDAPVSGGIAGAENGTLTIMCGGSEEAIARARPVLAAMGTNIIRAGDIGAGKDLKAVNNLIGAANTLIAAEGLMLAEKLGLDPGIAREVISKSSGQSSAFDSRFERITRGEFDGGFKLWLMMKDMRIALGSAEGVPMPLSQLAYQLYQLSSPKDADLDYAAVTKIYRNASGRG